MTNGEVIERLEFLKGVYSVDTETALDMAIEALSEVRCNDCKWNDDVVEVVRCKDCIHWKADNEVFELGFCCVFPQKWVAETFYCADGERNEP